jgi:hypothetical protein
MWLPEQELNRHWILMTAVTIKRVLSSGTWHLVIWQIPTKLYGITSQKTVIFIIAPMSTRNLSLNSILMIAGNSWLLLKNRYDGLFPYCIKPNIAVISRNSALSNTSWQSQWSPAKVASRGSRVGCPRSRDAYWSDLFSWPPSVGANMTPECRHWFHCCLMVFILILSSSDASRYIEFIIVC